VARRDLRTRKDRDAHGVNRHAPLRQSTSRSQEGISHKMGQESRRWLLAALPSGGPPHNSSQEIFRRSRHGQTPIKYEHG
jgi:hypothetical protein